MPSRPLRPCRMPGCKNLVQSGYCEQHKDREKDRFRQLDAKKTLEAKSFYSSARWTITSRRHRQIEPLCRRCAERGLVVIGEVVHHEPEREELMTKGLSPFDHKYLVTLCFHCHQEELRKKQKSS